MEFSKKLQSLRKEQNWTQEQLSEKLYVSRTAVSKWESGRGYPSIDSLKDIANIFNISIDQLLSNDEIINIAKYEVDINNKKTIHLIYSLLDLINVLLIFLPLYPNKIDNIIYSVSLISQNDLLPVIKIVYITSLSLASLIGLVELLLFVANRYRAQKIFCIMSFVLHVASILFYAISKQPYLTSIVFVLMIIKFLTAIEYVLKRTKRC